MDWGMGAGWGEDAGGVRWGVRVGARNSLKASLKTRRWDELVATKGGLIEGWAQGECVWWAGIR